MNLQFKSLTAGVAAFLLMSGIFANQALAAATPRPVITSPSTKSCVVGTVCSYTITATNTPTSYNATGLQSWQSRSSNVIAGTPTAAGTFSVTVSATNAGGTGSLVVAFTVTLPPARVVVAKSGGDYTTIAAAMAAINPTAANPVVIEVWPGVYNISEAIYPKSYVHIKGSGRDVTIIKPATGQYGFFTAGGSVTDVTISGFTVSGGAYGIYIQASNVTVSDNTISGTNSGILVEGNLTPARVVITENEISGSSQGIYLFDATAQITNNTLRGNNEGLLLIQSGNSIIQGNVITGSTGSGDGGSGVRIYNTRPAIVSNTVLVDNVITDNGTRGVWVVESTSGGTFTNNKILNNGGTLYSDVVIEGRDWSIGAPRTPNFSFNVFDDITGTLGVGSYNVKSNGDPILVP